MIDGWLLIKNQGCQKTHLGAERKAKQNSWNLPFFFYPMKFSSEVRGNKYIFTLERKLQTIHCELMYAGVIAKESSSG